MAANTNSSLLPEIGPDGLPREASVIAYTEKIIEEEQVQLRRYIEENYTKIRDVERELGNLTLEMKLTAGPKRAALEHMRKKIEMSTERIRIGKLKEEEARKAWEAASKVVKDEEAIKQKLCEDLNNLVQESSNSQFARLEELKRRLEALNPGRSSNSVHYASPSNFDFIFTSMLLQRRLPCFHHLTSSVVSYVLVRLFSDGKPTGPAQNSLAQDASPLPTSSAPAAVESVANQGNGGNAPVPNGHIRQPSSEDEGRGKKKISTQGRGKGIGAIPKGRGPGWTGSGFDVDGRN